MCVCVREREREREGKRERRTILATLSHTAGRHPVEGLLLALLPVQLRVQPARSVSGSVERFSREVQ